MFIYILLFLQPDSKYTAFATTFGKPTVVKESYGGQCGV